MHTRLTTKTKQWLYVRSCCGSAPVHTPPGPAAAQMPSLLCWLMPSLFCWLYAREGGRSRLGPNRQDLPQALRFPKRLRWQLSVSPSLPSECGGLNHRSSAASWHDGLRGLHEHVLGAVVLQPLWQFDALRKITTEQRIMREYWMATRYSEHQLFFLQVAAFVRLEKPRRVHQNLSLLAPRALLFPITPFSVDSLRSSRTSGGRLMGDMLQQWRSRFPDLIDDQVCLAMPAAHAILCLDGEWTTYAVPSTVRAASAQMTGIRYLRPLLRAMPETTSAPGQETIAQSLSPDDMVAIADILRGRLADMEGHSAIMGPHSSAAECRTVSE